jgi:pimeloyl-ACP methyl ester carboxylesterase
VTEEVTPGAIGERARAVEVARDYGDLRLAVRMEGERSIAPDVWDGLAKAIAESGLLRMADGNAPSVRIVLLPIRAHVGPQDPVPQLGPTAEPVLAVVSETGELMMAPREPGRFAEVLKNLEGWAAFRLKLAIDNPGSDLARGLSLELLRKDATGEWQPIPSDPSGGLRVVGVGDTIEIRLTNQGADTLYAGLFDFRPTGEVKRIFPVGGREPLEPGKSMMLGRGRGFRTSWPSGFPFQPNPFTDTPTQATETLKAFITSEETDFSYLEQGSASRALGGDASPFHRLLAASVSGATRDMEPVPPDDWATLALPFTLSAKTQATLDTAQPLKIGGIEVRADGAQAHIVAHGGERAHRRPGVPTIGRLDEALRSSHVYPVQTLGLDSVKTGSRAAGGEPELELAVAPPATGWGQLVMSTDEVGVVGWHFAEELSPDHVTSRSLSANVSTFRIPMRTVEPADGDTPASRGVVGMVGKKLLKVLVFPLMDPVFGAVGEHFASRFETARRPYGLRSFTPDDYRTEKGAPVDAETWRRLASGRSLLFVHGTFSRAHHAFHAIPPDMMRDLHRIYEGRVFAFDHKTLSDDPKANVTWLLEQLPDGVELNVDIVCHSRGGLVSRVLAERGDELTRTGCRIHVGRVIFVASPNAGTALAHAKHIGEFLERYTNLLNFLEVLPDNGVTDVLDGIITVAKQAAVGAFAGLVGLRAMEPGGAFEKWLAESTPNATRYYAIASDFNPTGPGLRERFMNGLMDKVFEGVPNDLVVPTASVYEGGVAPLFPISERLVLQGVEGVGHSGYFAAPGVQRRIFSWLEAAT